jgi:hypothetical protein
VKAWCPSRLRSKFYARFLATVNQGSLGDERENGPPSIIIEAGIKPASVGT